MSKKIAKKFKSKKGVKSIQDLLGISAKRSAEMGNQIQEKVLEPLEDKEVDLIDVIDKSLELVAKNDKEAALVFFLIGRYYEYQSIMSTMSREGVANMNVVLGSQIEEELYDDFTKLKTKKKVIN